MSSDGRLAVGHRFGAPRLLHRLRTQPADQLVFLVVAWNAWSLRATTDNVAYLDDASVHEQMVRFASNSVRSGSLPVSRWFPFLNLGSPQFLHYQGLGATLTGIVGEFTGADTAFRWSLYLMVVMWPLVIYHSARVFGLPSMAAGFAAALSPFLMSAPAVGYEQQAYLWIGYGLWAQLCASWILPLAWAWSWRAIDDRKYVLRAVVLVSVTAALHFETGYLAFFGVVAFPFVRPAAWRRRSVNAAVILAGSLVATSWVTVPLLLQSKWAALNTALAHTGLVRGYGARQDLQWLITGESFDKGRLPVVTVAVVIGCILAVVNWRRIPIGRTLVVLFVGTLLLSFGPTTWDSFMVLVPGHADLYFRRFLMGVQLSGIYLAGFGIYLGGSMLSAATQHISQVARHRRRTPRLMDNLLPLIPVILAVVLIVPAWNQLRTYDQRNAAQIGYQRRSEVHATGSIDVLLDYVKRQGGGRLYSGSPSNWGARFTVGSVPVFKYAESYDIDEVGYTIRTASLMSQPEVAFQANNLGDYALFGVRYVLLPPSVKPESWMNLVAARGQYRLFLVPSVHYLDTIHIIGVVQLNRSDVGPASQSMLRSPELSLHGDQEVNWNQRTPPVIHNTNQSATPGELTRVRSHLADGTAAARVHSSNGITVLLSASFDPGWRVTVDGTPAPVVQLAPAVLGVVVGPGTHNVVFTYGSYPLIDPLLMLSIAGVVLVAIWTRRSRPARSTTE